uniref:NmrA-like family domain-containing protein 1 n=1 Tax=Talaromyces marneffei PM1 TaxID=1077442 RepID=A0A093XMV2_TALMA
MTQTFLITGATGYQGGATICYLLETGATIHALVRNPNSPTAEKFKEKGVVIFKGDFDDVEAIKAATKGVDGVFQNLSPTWPAEQQIQQAKNIVNAALEAGTVKSIWGHYDPSHELHIYYTTKSAVEDIVKKADFPSYTILRPAWLYQNYLVPQSGYYFPELSTEGILAHVYEPNTRMPHIDVDNVEHFAAAALIEPDKFNGHEIELGNENLTLEETRELLSKAAGVDINTRIRSKQEVIKLGFKVGTLIFQQLANEKDLSIDGKALVEKYGIPFNNFGDVMTREKDELLKSIAGAK